MMAGLVKLSGRQNAPCDVLICTGIGRLHLIDTAVAVARAGFSVGMVTGWAPGRSQRRFVELAGKFLRQKRLFERLYDRRRVLDESGCELFQSPFAEAAVTTLARLRLGENDRLNAWLWRLCGWESRHHLKGGRVLHVRSGAGRGGVVARARRLGMKVIADHSIAHPAVIWRELRTHGAVGPATERFHPTSRFWKVVMDDCAEADLVLVNSHYVRETLIEQGFAAEKICVAYLGVDSFFHGAKQHHRELNGAPVRVLFTGHFLPRKGSHVLLTAARRLKESGVRAEFHVAGQAHAGPAEAAQAGVGAEVRFHGLLGRDALKQLIAESDVFVFPTLAEGCAKAAMEALGAGLPVITTRACGLPPEAESFVQLVASGDAHALAHAISKLGDDQARRVRCGEGGVRIVSTMFRPADYTATVGAVYHELLGMR